MASSRFRMTTAVIGALALAAIFITAFITTPADARHRHRQKRVCSETANLQYRACHAEVADSYYTGRAACLNELDDRRECSKELKNETVEAFRLCREQRRARKDFCDEFGQAAYAPDMDPDLFQDPRDPSKPNPYFPLKPGYRWIYEEDGERIDIRILDATKRIAGIDCIVYRDIVTEDDMLVEDTDDWFGFRKDGEIVYCGEEVKDYEFFDGDDPSEPELTSIDGRFKVGVDLAKSGTAFPANPTVGNVYRQEWDPGNAEDIGKVLSNDYRYGDAKDPELDEFVPEALAELMCPTGECVVIEDRSTLDPGSFERKYYAKGLGKFLEVKPEDGGFVPIVFCNFDDRCDELPIEEEDED